MTLKRCDSGGFALDLTQMRAHKSARFHGPTISSFSSMLNEVLELYLRDLEIAAPGVEAPYLWFPLQSGDTTRCLTSSQWTQFVKNCFKKNTTDQKAPPPKVAHPNALLSHTHAQSA